MNDLSLSKQTEGARVDGWFLFQGARVRTAAKTGKSYLAWEGLDISGVRIRGTLFYDMGIGHPDLKEGEVVQAVGRIGRGHVGLMVWAETLTKVDGEDATKFSEMCYPKVPQESLDKIISDLRLYSQCFQEPNLQELSKHLFAVMDPFLARLPAGKINHEAVRGGLAKHTWEVVTFCNNQLFLEKVDRDVLLFSALYHDIGKIREYNDNLVWAPEGRLVPHAAIAIELIADVMARNDIKISLKTLMHVKHCIMSHHGKEFSAVKPATREAIILHYADMVMSLLGHFDEVLRRGEVGEDGWASYSTRLETTPYIPQKDIRDLGGV